jgi:hypothetical protein
MSRIRIEDLSSIAPLDRKGMQQTGGGLFGLFGGGLFGVPFLFRRPRWRRRFIRPVFIRPRFVPVFGPGFGPGPFFPF